MSKLYSKIAIIAIAFILVTTISNNTAIALENQATPLSVWDKKTESDYNYSGVTEMVVYRSPSCGCCGNWLKHVKQHAFQVKDIKTGEIEALKQKYGVPTELASCHTAIIDGYIIEGHVPADDIKRFLAQKPDMLGLTVPGMVTGTPGMEMGSVKQPFKVLAFDNKGKVEVFNEYQSY